MEKALVLMQSVRMKAQIYDTFILVVATIDLEREIVWLF